MTFLTAVHTDIGRKKKTNQDSVLIKQATANRGQVLLASVCDGMGGLKKGELASAVMVRALDDWLSRSMVWLTGLPFTEDYLWQEWSELINETNRKIREYGQRTQMDLGTTMTAILIVDSRFYLVNVGDSRIYQLTDQISQLTRDQTLVQDEIDAGRLTYAQSLRDPRRHILTQCIGSGHQVRAEFKSGEICPGQVFLLCCDGFRHVVSGEELYAAFRPDTMRSEKMMHHRLYEMTELIKARRETDNISAILLKCRGDDEPETEEEDGNRSKKERRIPFWKKRRRLRKKKTGPDSQPIEEVIDEYAPEETIDLGTQPVILWDKDILLVHTDEII